MAKAMKPSLNGLECSNCGGTTLRVVDSRRWVNSIRRRRRCVCGVRFLTFEIASPTGNSNRLLDAVQLFDKVHSIPMPQRKAVMEMIDALRGKMPQGFAPPMIPPPEGDTDA